MTVNDNHLKGRAFGLRVRNKAIPWEDLFAAAFIFPTVMDKDTWRLVYWVQIGMNKRLALSCFKFPGLTNADLL